MVGVNNTDLTGPIYLRLSKEDDIDFDEPEEVKIAKNNQKEICISFMQKNKIKFNGQVYCDINRSGKGDLLEKRKDFKRLKEDSKNTGKTFNCFVFKDLSRFMRDVGQQEVHYKFFNSNGVKIVSVTEGFMRKVERQIRGVLNEAYIDDISEKVKKVHELRKENLKHNTKPPFGYKVLKHKSWQIVEDKAAIIRNIFKDLANNVDLKEVSKRYGIKNYKIFRIIRNRCYLGFYIYNKEFYPSSLPIVSEDIFNKVNAIYPLKSWKRK